MLGKYAQYDECKVHINGMAYADDEEGYEEHWNEIKTKFQFAVSYIETWHAKRHLWAYAWTHRHYNNGFTANSVAESSNAAYLGWMWRYVLNKECWDDVT